MLVWGGEGGVPALDSRDTCLERLASDSCVRLEAKRSGFPVDLEPLLANCGPSFITIQATDLPWPSQISCL